MMNSLYIQYKNQIENDFEKINFINLLKDIDISLNYIETEAQARDLLLRLLDKKEEIPFVFSEVVENLIEKAGYFPYLSPSENSSTKLLLHYEFYRSENIPDIIMHQKQGEIFDTIDEGKSLILSAPTSFGKSLLIEEIVASKKYKNIAIIFPTIALIDENREKLSKYRNEYKIIFTTKQQPGDKNIFLLTPERLVDFQDLPSIDYFVIDEFYKLGEFTDNKSTERANVLNHAFYKLLKMTNKFYLLGPNVNSIPINFSEQYPSKFITTDYFTVASNEFRVKKKSNENKNDVLNNLLETLEKPTLIYCKSPLAAEKNAEKYYDFIQEKVSSIPFHNDAIEWISKNVHSEWSLINNLQYKIAFHHGSIPRYLAKYIISEFNKGNIDYLFCTSTLIEGVNTAAKNVVIFDNIKGRNDKLTFFDYKNIRGRAGRMKKHFVGNIYNFNVPPENETFEVDFPWFTQTNASNEILVQLDESDLKAESKRKIEIFKNQDYLDIDTIKKNSNMKVEGQISLARDILENYSEYHGYLNWTGLPTYNQLKFCCELLWKHNLIEGKDNIYTYSQLTFFANLYEKQNSSLPALINIMIEKDSSLTPNKAVQKISKIVKSWFEFRFPKALLTLDVIQKEIYYQKSLNPGDYKYYASSIESAFCHPILSNLQEFGIPLTTLKKLEKHLPILVEDGIQLETVVNSIKKMDLSVYQFDPFEKKIMDGFLKSF